jgi:hypothetical protein
MVVNRHRQGGNPVLQRGNVALHRGLRLLVV